ncbi:MAG: S8 family serine peptidase [Candidatus Promineifilaceae bacterium]
MRKKTTRYSLKIFLSLTLFLAVVVVMAMVTVRTRARPQWQQKVDDWVLEEAGAADEVEFLVVLKDQADLGRISDRLSKAEKGAAVYNSLTDVALRSQASLIPDLKAAGADYRPFWISNMIWVRGDRTLVESLAGRPDVAHIAANPVVKLDLLPEQATAYSSAQDSAVEWNIALVQAPNVWAEGIDGSGVVIGGQDTGYDWQHPALMNQYRGWDGQSASHTYNWYDAIHEDNPNTPPGNPCGFDSPQPCDDQGHGTHTMGTMVGQDGAENQIGMAPGAQWIACRNMEQGWGTPATYAECYQWFVAPYPQDGDPFSDGDPTKAPHVINNSWSCPAGEGCVDPEVLSDVVNNVRAAGIVTVHSAGNNGYLGCGTINEPAAMYDSSFSVGATDRYDEIASFSSRGPSLQDDVPITKPEISAPGVGVNSSIPGDAYGKKQGTSMAAPHVAGLAALLINARPDLAGKVDLLEKLIQNSAVHLVTDQGCGDDGPQSVPNNVYGWGRIDAYSAYEAAVALPTPIPTPTPSVFIPTWFSP